MIFKNNSLEEKYKEEWLLTFGKHSFRVFPNTLSLDKHNNIFKYCLKLMNLAEGTILFDL